MKRVDEARLWTQLAQHKLTVGKAPEPANPATPWYMRSMLASMGWVGAMLIMAVLFSGLSGLLEGNSGRLAIGAILGTIAIFLFRADEDKDLRMQFALALSFAAQALIIWSIGSLLSNYPTLAALLILLLELSLLFFINNSIHRLASALVAAVALLFILHRYGLGSLGATVLAAAACWLWLKEFELVRWGRVLRPAAWALSLLAILLFGDNFYGAWLYVRSYLDMTPFLTEALTTLLTLGIVISVMYKLLTESGKNPMSAVSIAAIALLCLLSIAIPGIGFSLLLALVAFSRGNHLLLGLCLAGLLLHLSRYYYLLDIILLHKSLLLISSGLLLLGLRQVLLNQSRKAGTL